MRFSKVPLTAHALYLADLAERLASMESGRRPMNPLAYRLHARRLKSALAGYPEAQVNRELGRHHAVIAHVLEMRHFDEHGVLRGPGAEAAAAVALSFLSQLVDRA